jgi:hypothetical protein
VCRCPRFPLAAVIALLALPAASHATNARTTPVRDCGNYGFLPSGSRPVFTQREIEGAGTYDITARVSTCRTARRVVRIAHRARNNPLHPLRRERPACRGAQPVPRDRVHAPVPSTWHRAVQCPLQRTWGTGDPLAIRRLARCNATRRLDTGSRAEQRGAQLAASCRQMRSRSDGPFASPRRPARDPG